MKNRFLGEADAYGFLLVAVIVFGAIVAGAQVGGNLLALGAIVVLTPLAAGSILRKPVPEAGPINDLIRNENPRRILVVANETVAGSALTDEVSSRARNGAAVMVVCPALNSRLRYWLSDEDPARARAQARLQASIDRLEATGVVAHGHVGDSDPLQAIADALREFDADEIVISTHPPERSHWLARNITERAQRLFALPVTHVVVDLEHEAATGQSAAA
jgi:nucleotide-binding universal stress UspA family protein